MRTKYFKTIILAIIFITKLSAQSAQDHYIKAKEIYYDVKYDNSFNYKVTTAIEQLTYAIKKDKKFVEAYRFRGQLKNILLDHKGAIKDYTKALELVPNNLEDISARAFAYNFDRQYSKALKDYNKAIELAGENNFALSNLYYSRSLVKFNLKLKSEACEDLSKAGELGNSAAYEMIQKYCH